MKDYEIVEDSTDEEILEVQQRLELKPTLNLDETEYLIGDTIKEKVLSALNLSITNDTYCKGFLQCLRNKNRSTEDIFLIMKHYEPEVTLKEVREALFKLIEDGEVSSLWCRDIQKRVYLSNKEKFIFIHGIYLSDGHRLDENNLKFKVNHDISRKYNYSPVGGNTSYIKF
jgi:hypothetical protein